MRQDKMEADAKEIAEYMKQAFQKAFGEDPQDRFRVVDSPAPGCPVLEMAVGELVPSHSVMEALTLAAPYGPGVAIQAATRGSGVKATVAFEAKIQDGDTGEILTMAAGREEGKTASINLP